MIIFFSLSQLFPIPSYLLTHPTYVCVCALSFSQNTKRKSTQTHSQTKQKHGICLVLAFHGVWDILSDTTLEKTDFPFLAGISWSWVGICVCFVSSVLEFCLVWTCAGLMHAVTVSVSSCFQSCCILKILFHWSCPPTLTLMYRSPSLERRALIGITVRAECSKVLHAHKTTARYCVSGVILYFTYNAFLQDWQHKEILSQKMSSLLLSY